MFLQRSEAAPLLPLRRVHGQTGNDPIEEDGVQQGHRNTRHQCPPINAPRQKTSPPYQFCRQSDADGLLTRLLDKGQGIDILVDHQGEGKDHNRDYSRHGGGRSTRKKAPSRLHPSTKACSSMSLGMALKKLINSQAQKGTVKVGYG